MGAAYHVLGARRTAQLVDAVRGVLDSSRHSGTRSSGAHLLILQARIYLCGAKEAQPGDNGPMELALRYAVLALQHWGRGSACTAAPLVAVLTARDVQSALDSAPAEATVARHCTATVAAAYGVWLSHNSDRGGGDGPQRVVAAALQTFRQLHVDSLFSSARIVLKTLRSFQGYFRRPSIRPVIAFRDAYTGLVDAGIVTQPFGDYCSGVAAAVAAAPMSEPHEPEQPRELEVRFSVLLRRVKGDG